MWLAAIAHANRHPRGPGPRGVHGGDDPGPHRISLECHSREKLESSRTAEGQDQIQPYKSLGYYEVVDHDQYHV